MRIGVLSTKFSLWRPGKDRIGLYMIAVVPLVLRTQVIVLMGVGVLGCEECEE